LLTLVDKIK
jgi:hypothetical protein